MLSTKKSGPISLSKFCLVAGVVAGSVLSGTAAQAITAATFSLTTPTVTNSTSIPFSDNGIGLTVSDAAGTNLPGSAINTQSLGLCSYAEVGTSSGRCALTQGSNATFNGFNLTFDTSVFLKTFDVLQFAGLGSGSITFAAGSQSETFNLSGTGLQTFTSPFVASAGNAVTVTTTGTPLVPNGGVFRISNLSVEEVPGPLPLLGVGAAFAYSRKLRRKTAIS